VRARRCAVLGHYDTRTASFEYLPIAADAVDGSQGAFARPGTLLESIGDIHAVSDPAGDGVDRDCDGLD
jgi:hypothetical protein